jgi:hypothetical protein
MESGPTLQRAVLAGMVRAVHYKVGNVKMLSLLARRPRTQERCLTRFPATEQQTETNHPVAEERTEKIPCAPLSEPR